MPNSTGASSARKAAPDAVPAPAIVLVEPQLGENIGAAARAMANFALVDLRLVAPRDGWPSASARANAAGADWVIDRARLFSTTAEAVADLHFLCATTARVRDMAKPILSPAMAARQMWRRARAGQACGVLFGAEKSGLSNDDVALADAVVMAPVNPSFASLNLAQAVLILGYEWMLRIGPESLGRRTPLDGPARPGLPPRKTRPATRAELLALFAHLERELDAAGFLHPPEKRPAMVRSLRNMFLRMAPSEQDVRTLRGVVAALSNARKGAAEPS